MSSVLLEHYKESRMIFPGERQRCNALPPPRPFDRPRVITTSQNNGPQRKSLYCSLTRPRSGASSPADIAACSLHLFHIRLSDGIVVKRSKLINIHDLCSFISVVIALTCALFQGNVTFSCDEPVSVAVTFPGPQSFLQLPGATTHSSGGTAVGFQFRTWNQAGLLLTFALPQEGGVAWLYLSEARLRLQIHRAGRLLLELRAGEAGGLKGHFRTTPVFPHVCVFRFCPE